MPLRCTYLLRSKSDGQIADRKTAHTDAAVPCTSPVAGPKAVRRKVTGSGKYNVLLRKRHRAEDGRLKLNAGECGEASLFRDALGS